MNEPPLVSVASAVLIIRTNQASQALIINQPLLWLWLSSIGEKPTAEIQPGSLVMRNSTRGDQFHDDSGDESTNPRVEFPPWTATRHEPPVVSGFLLQLPACGVNQARNPNSTTPWWNFLEFAQQNPNFLIGNNAPMVVKTKNAPLMRFMIHLSWLLNGEWWWITVNDGDRPIISGESNSWVMMANPNSSH